MSSLYPLRLHDANLSVFSIAGYLVLAAFAFYALRSLYRTLLWYPYLSSLSALPGPERTSYIRGNIASILKAEPGIEVRVHHVA